MGRKRTVHLNLPVRMKARVRPSGVYYYYFDGQREHPLGKDLVLAVKKWADLESTEAHRQAIAPITFRQVAELYLKKVVPTKAPRTQKDNLGELKFLYKFFDNPPAPLDGIEPKHIAQYRDWRKVTRSTQEIALLSHIWNWAREQGHTKLPNPCVGVARNRSKGRDVYIEDALFQKVYDLADQPTRDAMDLAHLVGQRPGDCLSFMESDIVNGALLVEQGKTGKKLRVRIEGKLKEVLDRIAERKAKLDASPVLLTASGKPSRRAKPIRATSLLIDETGSRLTYDQLDSRFGKARKAAGIKPREFQFRDLRAKAATEVEEADGIERATKLLGHADQKMTRKYVRNRLGVLVNPTK